MEDIKSFNKLKSSDNFYKHEETNSIYNICKDCFMKGVRSVYSSTEANSTYANKHLRKFRQDGLALRVDYVKEAEASKIRNTKKTLIPTVLLSVTL